MVAAAACTRPRAPFPGVVARAASARRILEVGTGLGYSALWLAHASGPRGSVDTIERDELHTELAREQIRRAGHLEQITVLLGG